MKTGLYFGSFNPIHNGHLIIAQHVINYTDIQQIWFVVSPRNPLKPSKSLLNEYHRLHLVRLATEGNAAFQVSDVEYHLPKPSYTIDTLTYLEEKHKNRSFSIIMGSDSFGNLQHWKNGEKIALEYEIKVYERPGFQMSDRKNNVQVLQAPLLDISATQIRRLIKEGKSIKYMVPDLVIEEIKNNRYYK